MADFSLLGTLGLNARNFIQNAERAAESIGATNKTLKDTQEEADKAESRLGKMGEAAGSIPGPIGDVADKLSGAGGVVAGIGVVAGAMIKVADETARARLEVADYAQLTGDSVENASRLLTVVGRVGVEANDLADITLQMSGALADNEDLATRLGVDLNDGATAAERFVEVTGKLQTEITDATERGIIGSQLFGEEGVRQVNAITSQVGDLDKALKGVEDRNVVTDEQVRDAREYKQAMDDLQEALQGAAVIITDALLPSLTRAAESAAATGDALPIEDFVKWGEKINDNINPVRLTTRAYTEMRKASVDLEGAISPLAGTIDNYTQAQDLVNESIADSLGLLEEQRDAADEATESITELERAANELLGTISDRQAWLNLADDIERYSSTLRDSTASAREKEQATLSLKQSLIEYALTLESIPEEQVTEVIALIDEGSFRVAQARLAVLTARETKVIDVYFPGITPVPNDSGFVPVDQIEGYGAGFSAASAGFSAAVAPTSAQLGSAGFATAPQVNVGVSIGNQDITDIVDVTVDQKLNDRGQRR